MFDTIQYTKIITPPDRLLTEVYKDGRDADKRKFDRLNKLLNYPTLDRIKMRLYKMSGNDIITDCGERVHKNEIKWFIDYKEKWGY